MTDSGISAVVVAHVLEDTLDACLASCSFADELLLVELGRVPGLEDVAERHGARVLRHEPVPVVEHVRGWAADAAAHDWVLFVDPDEEITPGLADALGRFAERALGDVASARVPWRFYFAGEELRTTEWGKPHQTKRVLVQRQRVEFVPRVHRGIELRPGTREVHVGERPDAVLKHYWCDSYRDFVRRHRRYLRHEGRSRWERGERFSWFGMLRSGLFQLGADLIYHRGLLGGVRGTALSFLHAWYEVRSWWSLREFQSGRDT